ncbi:MAG: transposase [Betaproteobacteria bacterium]|nr:transposase [Betaproteobacteria bacterium]
MPSTLPAQAPGHPLHVIQRGYCRLACFFGDADRIAYLGHMRECAEHSGCAVHAYVLMGNHVHLLVTPSRAEGASHLMRLLREHYCRYFGETHGRLDPVLDERFQALPLRSRQHLLSCMQYIELNPVRAQLVRSASDYRWSSYRANALGQEDPLVTPHTCYYALGRTVISRQQAYRALFEARSSGRARGRVSARL